MNGFREKLLEAAANNNSRLILAADTEDYREVQKILSECHNGFAAIKVHAELVRIWAEATNNTEIGIVEELKKSRALIIVDAKLADIDKSNATKTKYYYNHGYDAIISHGFEGEEAAKAPLDMAHSVGMGFLLLTSMTTKGSMFSDDVVDKLVSMAGNLKVDGVIAPGNKYDVLEKVRKAIGKEGMILSPGIGTQGGEVEKAMKFSDFAIVGRSIVEKPNPAEYVKDFNRKINLVKLVDPELLNVLVRREVMRFGEFKLKSGRPSAYFFTTGNIDTGEAFNKMKHAYAKKIVENGWTDKFDVIFGPAYKGITIAAGVADALYEDYGIDKRFAYDRKEEKDHGVSTEKKIVGNFRPGDRVLMLDDVITTGATKEEEIKLLRSLEYKNTSEQMVNYGLKPVLMLVLFDREEVDMEGKDPISELTGKYGIASGAVISASKLMESLVGKDIDGKILVDEHRYMQFLEHQEKFGRDKAGAKLKLEALAGVKRPDEKVKLKV